MMVPRVLIAKKRDGGEHNEEEIQSLVRAFLKGELSDYQMSAWLMAVYLRGLSEKETVALTVAMLHSGKVIQHPKVKRPKIDKHSTGGVGDKLSIPLAPWVAAAGLAVPMISGRGLGHTGGTLDKLEAIPGYDTRLSIQKFQRIVRQTHASIIGQTPELAPADRAIYALRDVTATVECIPLIVASILSKKLAAGLDGLVLDVKVGRGAFMKDLKSAKALAAALTHVSESLGTRARALLTRMDAPLGATIGNALEVRESIDILKGTGPSDTSELTLQLGEEMLILGGVCKTHAEARRKLLAARDSGAALDHLRQMILAHGGDGRVVDRPELLPQSRYRILVQSSKAGFLQDIDSLALAELALEFGAGRKRASDSVDPAVGIELNCQLGSKIARGDTVAVLHTSQRSTAWARRASLAFHIGPERLKEPKLVLGRVGG